MFRARVKQLQDSHAKFRSQIKALENVKDLTISLQSQLSIMEQENQQLAKENAELTDLNRQAAQLIEEKQSSEKQLQERAHEADLRCENIQGRYLANQNALHSGFASEELEVLLYPVSHPLGKRSEVIATHLDTGCELCVV